MMNIKNIQIKTLS